MPLATRFRLSWESGGVRRVFDVAPGQFRIGRSPECEVSIADYGLSRFHARLSVEGRRVVILDTRSKGGIQVNGEAVRETELKDGDTLSLGTFQMRFEAIEVGADRPGWREHQILPGLFEVDTAPTEAVARVYSIGWELNLIARRPVGTSSAALEHFARRAREWVEVGLHPNVVSCVFVTTVEGLPCVFCRPATGGSLADRIRSGSLAAGTPGEVLHRLLLWSSQLARALAHCHGRGVVHGSLSPRQVAMGREAALLDFGPTLEPPSDPTEDAFYAAPELTPGAAVTPAADVWSWAAIVVEGCCGNRLPEGVSTPTAALQWLGDEPANRVPPHLVEVLRRCLETDPARRPARLAGVADEILDRGRAEPEAIRAGEATADHLNNRGLSLAHLGDPSGAEEFFRAAIAADPLHAEASFNLAVLPWRLGAPADLAALESLEDLLARSCGSGHVAQALAALHAERGDAEAERSMLEEALQRCPEDRAIRLQVEVRRERPPERSVGRLECGQAPIRCTALATDGRTAAAGDADGAVHVWDVTTAQRLHELRLEDPGRRATGSERAVLDHEAAPSIPSPELAREEASATVSSIALSFDGRRLCAGLECGSVPKHLGALERAPEHPRGQLVAWELVDPPVVRPFPDPLGPVMSLSMSQDGRRIVFVSIDPEHVDPGGPFDHSYDDTWNLPPPPPLPGEGRAPSVVDGPNAAPTWEELPTHEGFPSRFQVRVWDPHEGLIRQLDTRGTDANGVSLSGDGRFAAISTSRGVVVWDLSQDPAPPRVQGPHGAPDPSAMGLSMDDEPAVLRRLPAAQKRLTIPPVGGAVVREWRQSADRSCALLHTAGDAILFDLRRVRPVRTWRGVSAVAIDGQGETVALGTEAGTLEIWRDAHHRDRERELLPSRPLDFDEARELTERAGELRRGLGSAMESGESGEALRCAVELRSLRGQERTPDTMTLWARAGPLGRRTGFRGTWVLGQVELGKSTGVIRSDRGPAFAPLALTHDGQHVVWTQPGTRGFAELRTLDGRPLRRLEGSLDRVTGVFLSGDRRLAMARDFDGLVVWDLATGQRLHTVATAATAAALLGDGSRVLTATGRGLELWDVAGGRQLRELEHPGARSLGVDFDERIAASVGEYGWMKLWDLASGECLEELRGAPIELLFRHARLRGDRMRWVNDSMGSGALLECTSDGRWAVNSPALYSDEQEQILAGRLVRTPPELQFWDLLEGRMVAWIPGARRIQLAADAHMGVTEDGRVWCLDWEIEPPE